MRMARIWLCLMVLLAPALASAEVPLSAFTGAQQVHDVKISPDGRYIASLISENGQTSLGITPISPGNSKKGAVVAPGDLASVADFWWVGPNRVVMALAAGYENFEEPILTGELYAANADGADQKYLFGYRAPAMVTGTAIQHVSQTYGSAEMVRTLPDDPQHAVIAEYDWDNTNSDNIFYTTYKLNVETGALTDEVRAPTEGDMDFVASRSGIVRYATGTDEHLSLFSYVRGPDGSWKELNSSKTSGARIHPLQLSEDETKVYLKSDEGGDRYCLVEENLVNGERRKLSCDDVADLDHVIFSFDGTQPIAAVYESDRPSVRLLDTEHPDRAKLQALEKAIGDEIVEPVSHTPDGSKVVLRVYSDRDPGQYHVLDTKTMHTDLYSGAWGGIDPDQMGERRPISFKARDGQTVHGYLTLPPGKQAKNLPLVVYPHGGPFWVFDQWDWDPEPQLLASRGYAVLQVNYRGSGGYGYSFIKAGHEHWDTVMIDDITDGTRWVAAQGVADPKRLCIYGVSYGGYAALASAVREPDLYRCAVAFAGIYDLSLWQHDSDVSESRNGRNYISEFVGATPERLKEASPLTHIDRLKAAIMIVHGERDERVPISQAKALRKALDERHYPYEWLVKPDEGHGFFLPANRLDFYTKLLAFLDKNIGADAVPAVATAAAAASVPTPADMGAPPQKP